MKWMRQTPTSPIGLDVSGRLIAAVQLTGRHDQWALKAATVLRRTAEGPALEARDIQRLNDVLSRQGFAGRRIVLTAPSEKLLTGVLELPAAGSGAPLDQIARMELARMHKTDPQSFEMAYWNLPSRARGGEGTQVMAAACPVADANSVLDPLEHAGFDLTALDVPCVAMKRACAPLLNQPNAVVLLNLQWESATIILCHQGVIVYERALQDAGLKKLHDSLVGQFNLNNEVAEFIITDGGLNQGAALSASGAGSKPNGVIAKAFPTIANHWETLVREVRVSCSYIAHRYPDSASKTVVVCGEGAAMPGLHEYLGRALDMESHLARPLNLITCPAGLSDIACNPALTTALGLAQFGENQ